MTKKSYFNPKKTDPISQVTIEKPDPKKDELLIEIAFRNTPAKPRQQSVPEALSCIDKEATILTDQDDHGNLNRQFTIKTSSSEIGSIFGLLNADEFCCKAFAKKIIEQPGIDTTEGTKKR